MCIYIHCVYTLKGVEKRVKDINVESSGCNSIYKVKCNYYFLTFHHRYPSTDSALISPDQDPPVNEIKIQFLKFQIIEVSITLLWTKSPTDFQVQRNIFSYEIIKNKQKTREGLAIYATVALETLIRWKYYLKKKN